jgi:hypothetical protein
VCSSDLAPFTAGNLVVYRVGDGTNTLVNTGGPVFLDEYTTNGTYVQSIPLPTTQSGGNYPFTSSGVATSEGELTTSTDGQYVLLTGYGTNSLSSSLASSQATNVPRVVARVDVNGNVDTSTALRDFAPGNNPRSVASPDGTNLWVGGAAASVRYALIGTTNSTQLGTGVTNIRQVHVFNNQVYFSTASGSSFRIGTAGPGLPTTSGQVYTNLPGFPTSGGSPYGYALVALAAGATNHDTLYVADDNADNNGLTGGIFKYSLVGSTWTSNGFISAPGVRGLVATVQVSGTTTNALLYGSTGGPAAGATGTLYAFTDSTGYNAVPSGSATALITTVANLVFRGITFAPASATPPPPAAPLKVLSISKAGNDISITWTAPGGTTNAVQATNGVGGSYETGDLTDISVPFINAGPASVGVTNTYVDSFGATNAPARYYRVRQVP